MSAPAVAPHRRGTSNTNARGNVRDRAARRAYLLATYGDGVTCPCYRCGCTLDDSTITVDRIVPGRDGGRYTRDNIRPACGPCNSETGGALARKVHLCVDCLALPERPEGPHEEREYRPRSPRPAPHGGPRSRRCATHHRRHRAAQRAHAHETRVWKVYGLAPGEYAELLAAQGGTCAICRRATGQTRRLAVDHDHETGEVRGLLCKPCNRTVLGHGGSVLRRAVAYLDDPPAAQMRRLIAAEAS